MSVTSGQQVLFRASLDLVAARLHCQTDLLHDVLADLDTGFDGEGVCGLLGVAATTVRKAAIVNQQTPFALLAGLTLDGGGAFDDLVPDVLALLYLIEEDQQAAHAQARDLEPGFGSRPVMTMLADVTVVMLSDIASFARVSPEEVFGYLRVRSEWQFRAHAA